MKTKQYTALYPYTGEVIGKVTARSRPEGYELLQRVLHDDCGVFLTDGRTETWLMRSILSEKQG